MPYQNRVDPFGEFFSTSAHGDLMGNRGILHDDEKHIVRKHKHQNWITCSLSFKGRKRSIMGTGTYTELFFHDEAAAYAAGHRPCAECRKAHYDDFTTLWRRVHGEVGPGMSISKTIDRMLHASRIARGGEKITYRAAIEDLPNGTLVSTDDRAALLIWRGRQHEWSLHGYTQLSESVTGIVTVLTPRPIVDLFREGLAPSVRI